jgi:O-antigen/teichoic acid export membrane protein
MLQYAWLARLVLREHRGIVAFRTTGWLRLAGQAWPVTISTSLKSFWQQVPVLALSAMSFQAAGLFNAANRIPGQITFIPLALITSGYPVLSRSWAVDKGRFQLLLEHSLDGIVLFVLPATVFAVGISRPLTDLIFGQVYHGAAVPLALLLIVSALLFPAILFTEALNAAGYQKTNLVLLLLSTPPLMISLLLLSPRFGAVGAATAVLISSALFLVLTAGAAVRLLGLRSMGPVALTAACAATVGAVVLTLGTAVSDLVSASLAMAASGLTVAALRPGSVRMARQVAKGVMSQASDRRRR